jgi:hypothetical protein
LIAIAAAAVGCGIYAFRLVRRYGWPENTAINFFFRKDASGLNKKTTGSEVHGVGRFGGHNYSTTFPIAEGRLSEGASWVEADTAGAGCDHHPCWGNMQSIPGEAFGVSEPTRFGDPTAILTGTWGPDQTAEGTVVVSSAQPWRGCCHELELRLRTTISANAITGYEVYCSLIWTNPYCHIASWGGPNGSYVNLDECLGHTPAVYLKDGDTLKATITGTKPVIITAFVNGLQIMQILDEGMCTFSDGKKHGPWITGNPGIGQYDSKDSDFRSFGWSRFSAMDGLVPLPLRNP